MYHDDNDQYILMAKLVRKACDSKPESAQVSVAHLVSTATHLAGTNESVSRPFLSQKGLGAVRVGECRV